MNCDFDLLEEKLLLLLWYKNRSRRRVQRDIWDIEIYMYIQFKNILENTLLEEVLIKNTYSAHVWKVSYILNKHVYKSIWNTYEIKIFWLWILYLETFAKYILVTFLNVIFRYNKHIFQNYTTL